MEKHKVKICAVFVLLGFLLVVNVLVLDVLFCKGISRPRPGIRSPDAGIECYEVIGGDCRHRPPWDAGRPDSSPGANTD